MSYKTGLIVTYSHSQPPKTNSLTKREGKQIILVKYYPTTVDAQHLLIDLAFAEPSRYGSVLLDFICAYPCNFGCYLLSIRYLCHVLCSQMNTPVVM